MRALARNGASAGEIARLLERPAREVVLRLVELELGPLGRVRPMPGAMAAPPKAGRFADIARPAKAGAAPDAAQQPVLRLAAAVLGDSLQRLGDRLFLDGREIDLPRVVTLARDRGAPIRYPGIAPMERALAGGPSIRPRRRARPAGGAAL